MARRTKTELENENAELRYDLRKERDKNALNESKEKDRKKTWFQGIYLACVIALFTMVDEGYGLWVIFGSIPIYGFLSDTAFKEK